MFSSVTKAHSAAEQQSDSSSVHAENRLEVSFLFQTTCQNNRFSQNCNIMNIYNDPSKDRHSHIFQGPFLPSSASHFLPCGGLKTKRRWVLGGTAPLGAGDTWLTPAVPWLFVRGPAERAEPAVPGPAPAPGPRSLPGCSRY